VGLKVAVSLHLIYTVRFLPGEGGLKAFLNKASQVLSQADEACS
jgi:hypothetical protein